jgi:purine-nucleoside phosphorylase
MVSHPQPSVRQQAQQAAEQILARCGGRSPQVAMLLGTGHASIAGQLKGRVAVGIDELAGRVRLTGNGQMHAGELDGVPVILADAPLASYEAQSAHEIVYPVRVLRATGAEVLILTAGAASLCLQIEPGSIAIVEDHLNFSGQYPLHGPNDDQLGPRFPDMSDPYDAGLRETARRVAAEAGIPCLQGVFAAVPGPTLPTRAEYRFFGRIGADLVGMSLVPESIAAVHAGFRVLALVGVTQMVNLESHTPVSIESMIDAADVAAPRMASIVAGVVASLRE